MSEQQPTPPAANRRGQILSKAGVLAAQKMVVPEWDGIEIEVIELTGQQARLFEEAVAAGADAPLGMLLQMSICDPDTHALMFEPADRGTLEQLGMQALKPIIKMAQELSGIDQTDLEKAQAFLAKGRTAPTS